MTPLLREIGKPGPRDYEIKTRKLLEEFNRAENILYLDLLPIFKSVLKPDSLYRDHIHLSPEGNQVVSQNISQLIINHTQFLAIRLVDFLVVVGGGNGGDMVGV